jgi:hypothetical protein
LFNFDDNGNVTGGALGTGGLGFAVNETSQGNTLKTVNIYQAAKNTAGGMAATWQAFKDDLKQFGRDATRAMTCPSGCPF